MALERFLRLFRHVRRLERANARLREEVAEANRFYPAGHFYSPLPSRAEIDEAFARGGMAAPFAGVDLREAEQFALLESIARFYPDQPFPEEPVEGRRYHLDNPSYGHCDGIMLACLLRHSPPQRIIEVGSGFSSAAMLDLNEHVFAGGLKLTFIDPDMARLRPLLRPEDEERVTLIEKKVQDVPLAVFGELAAGDVLFIDSSHVSKIGSDVNRLYFDVLPGLAAGVQVHIHDIAWNLEYPREWLDAGRAWNEQYLLRAFLMYNPVFRVELMTSLMIHLRREFVTAAMPLCARGGGGQIWLKKRAGAAGFTTRRSPRAGAGNGRR